MELIQQHRMPEEFDQIKPDLNHSQLLIQIGPHPKTFEEAKKILEEIGVHIMEAAPLSSHWILLKLDVKDMRDVTLKLIENGFSNIKGINAKR